MYIKMNDDKSLVVTVPTTIYQGERNADLITFLIPGYYNGDNLADYAIVMNYVLPSGVRYHEDLVCHPEMYKSYLRYGTKIDTRFTEEAGVVRIWLAALDDNDDVILKTDEVIIAIQESDDVTGYPTPDEVEKLNKLEEKLDKLAEKVVQSDWNQNDSSADSYVKNRTHWEEMQLITLLPEMTVVIEEDRGGYVELSSNITRLTIGQEYHITLNGVEYACVAREWNEDDSVTSLIGNGTICGDGNEGNGEPFSCDSYEDGSIYLNAAVGEYTISISTSETVAHKLDSKYLPTNLATTDDVQGAVDVANAAQNTADAKMDKTNPVGTGSFSMNRKPDTIVGDYSHAEGNGTTASEYASHAEGNGTTASGSASHAEGYWTVASGDHSHAEGEGSNASGYYSHAEGWRTTASGTGSHAEGDWTVASGACQHVQGEYNIIDTPVSDTNPKGKYAHIVGNGIANDTRSNAHTLDWNGIGWFQGGLQVGGYAQDDGAKNVLLEGDAIPVPVDATVGQTIVVKSVDENGKPTEWEAVDMGGVELDVTLSMEGKAADAKAVGDAISQISSQNGDGLTTAQINALDGMFKVCAFTKADVSAEYNAFKTAFGISDSGGEEEPDEPVTPEKTLTGISATYSGGDMAVGTAVSALTGIVVTAHYSDGTSDTVTGYTLSGEIAEGENVITVSYGGKTATFTVTGIAESTGENNGWTDGESYAIEWTDGYIINNDTGEPTENTSFSISSFLPCAGASAVLSDTNVAGRAGFYWGYDADKNYIGRTLFEGTYPNAIPNDVKYLRVCKSTSVTTGISPTPVKYKELTENTVWESGEYYDIGFTPHITVDITTGKDAEGNNNSTSNYCMCYGASKITIYPQNATYSRRLLVFYDADKNVVGGSSPDGTSIGWVSKFTECDIPENAVYFRISSQYQTLYGIVYPDSPIVTLE